MNFQYLLLPLLLLTSTFTQKTYFGNFGKSYCPLRASQVADEKINWEKNYICNGDFETPKLDDSIYQYQYAAIPCWKSAGKFELSKPINFSGVKSQILELDPDDNGYAFSQKISLHEGKYEFKFDS